jgi:hypothetical protein
MLPSARPPSSDFLNVTVTLSRHGCRRGSVAATASLRALHGTIATAHWNREEEPAAERSANLYKPPRVRDWSRWSTGFPLKVGMITDSQG